MPRSSRGSRLVATWAVAQKPRPKPRVVRLGRPANDNARNSGLWARALVVAVAAALAVCAFYGWRLI